MSAFRRGGKWVAKFQLAGKQHWVPGGPWSSKRAAQEAERRYRDRLTARRTAETCASFAERWLREWPRPAESTRRSYAHAMKRLKEDFGPTPLGEVERLSARSWALGVPRNVSRVVGIMYEDARNIGLVEHNPFSNLRLPATERTQEVHPPSMEEYRELLDEVPRRPDPFVFHSPRGNPLVQGSHHYAWRQVRAASGIPIQRAEAGLSELRWHDWRHFCATQLLELGVDHFAVSVQLGHEDGGALVMSRYGHPSKEAARGRLLAAFQLTGSATV